MTEKEAFDDVFVIVTSSYCEPPKLTIPFKSVDNLAPVEYARSDQIVISCRIELNCGAVTNTK